MFMRSAGMGVQALRPSARSDQSFSRSVAPPGKRQAAPMMAMGGIASPFMPLMTPFWAGCFSMFAECCTRGSAQVMDIPLRVRFLA